MKLSFDVTDYSVLSNIWEEEQFMTSLNIIREVMNVPQCALNSILRANGYNEVAPDSICIDEKMLSIFADAYIRKMKSFFLGSVRNVENLSYEEITDLNEFYNTYKKQEVKFVRRAEWSQIDTELIRDAFMNRVKELTPRKKSRFDFIIEHIFETCELSDLNDYYEYNLYQVRTRCSDKDDNLLSRITHNRFYFIKQKVKKAYCCSVNIMRQLFVAARYHIFVADDTDLDRSMRYNVSLLSLSNYINSNNYEQTINKKCRSEQLIR